MELQQEWLILIVNLIRLVIPWSPEYSSVNGLEIIPETIISWGLWPY